LEIKDPCGRWTGLKKENVFTYVEKTGLGKISKAKVLISNFLIQRLPALYIKKKPPKKITPLDFLTHFGQKSFVQLFSRKFLALKILKELKKKKNQQ